MIVKLVQAAAPALVQALERLPVQQGRTAAEHGSQQNLANSKKLLTPSIELPRADPVFARYLGWRQVRSQALANDLALLLHGPGPAPIGRAEDLPRGDASARKTNLYERSQSGKPGPAAKYPSENRITKRLRIARWRRRDAYR
jgi:hypothetical protein